ncbi:hypothetical protein BCR44DRAFT_61597 [Catenaria anguillulae PL171]|uniref:Uncharacterized protein n=1 Tax=Catenaria anguillulae PL171 TaxID=765915 RepID=A0A1Y2HXX0_9FUNG|nr:hypothetical protein BCR44DRAFT_61597 [Catenaria anguillulae PL171]
MPPPCKAKALALPDDLWASIADAILADTSNRGRQLDLARLAWTCRAAYFAAHRPLWQHLRLMIRHDQLLTVRHHENVFESSLFPRYCAGQLSMDSERLKRIRKVSRQFPHLQPFVVLDGKLFLASLVENERNPSAPDVSGMTSLWGDRDGSLFSAGAQVVGGLVLVPYPLVWVNELTVDGIGSVFQICSWDPASQWQFRNHLAFLFNMPRDQIHTLHCNAGYYYDDVKPAFYHLISRHFSGVAHHDYLLNSYNHSSPEFGPLTRTVRLFRCPGFESDGHVFSALASAPIQAYEQYGWGTCDLRSNACEFLSSSTLVRLVLDYQIERLFDYDPFPIHLPALKHLTITFEIATHLFKSNNHHQSSHSKPIMFPSLTHLTLVNVERGGDYTHPPIFLPWIPYHHMPRLTYFHVPFKHRGIQRRQAMYFSCLHSLVSHTRLESLCLPGLTACARVSAIAVPTIPAIPLMHLEAMPGAIKCLSSLITAPRLASVILHTPIELDVLPIVQLNPNLTQLTLFCRECHNAWWHLLADTLPRLTHLTITINNHHYPTDDTALTIEASSNKYPVLPNLEHLSFTLANGTIDFTGLELPNLKHLAINMQHPHTFPSVYPHLESLRLTGALCPVQVIRLLADLSAHCRVKFLPSPVEPDSACELCSVLHLPMRFAGAQNQHVWRALLDAAPFAKLDGLIKESVTVVLDQSGLVVQDGDAQLIAQVLAHLLREQAAASIKCFVTCGSSLSSKLPTAEDVQFRNAVVRAIVDKGIAAFSADEFR